MASWGWSTVPQKHLDGRVIRYTQAKVIGGGSTINAQLYTRGNAKDYDGWATDAGCVGWSYKEVLPYFKRSEDNQRLVDAYHGYGGPLGVSWPVSPLADQLRVPARGAGGGHPLQRRFQRRRPGRHGPLSTDDARRDAQFHRFGVPEAGARAAQSHGAHRRRDAEGSSSKTAARSASRSPQAAGAETIRATREVIVSCGAIGSPRLLQLSGIGPADELRKAGVSVVHDLAGVGGNLQDHLDLYVDRGMHRRSHLRPRRAIGPHDLGGAAISLVQERAGDARRCSISAASGTPTAPRARPTFSSISASARGSRRASRKMRNPGVTLNSAFLRPRSRGTVRLASADPAAAPLIDPNYWADPYDRECAIKGLRLAREIMRQPALKPFVLAERLPGDGLESDEELAQYAYRSCKTDHHPVGNLRDGDRRRTRVTTPELRLRGLDGLRVVDASVMPFVPSCNTNAPTIMVAEKAADMILGKAPLAAASL